VAVGELVRGLGGSPADEPDDGQPSTDLQDAEVADSDDSDSSDSEDSEDGDSGDGEAGDRDESASASAPRGTGGPVILAKGLGAPTHPARLHYSAPSESGGTEERDVDASGGSRQPPPSGGYRRTQPRRSSKKARRRGK
jgi:hypothetical protein